MASLRIKNRHDALALLRNGRMAVFAPRLVEWLLVALIAFLLARTAIAFFAPLPLPVGERLAALPTAANNSDVVKGRNPFPKSVIAPAAVEAGPDLAETALDLTLTGVWPKAENGSAIIRRPDGTEKRFAIGEEITSGVRLLAVYQDQIVIEQNGVRESLRFETKAPVPYSTPRMPVDDVSNEDKIVNTPTDAASLGRAFRLAPGVDTAGKPALLLHPGADRAAFKAAGFQAGDILRTINGSPPPMSPNELTPMMSQFMKSGAATLVVERNGEMKIITLSTDRSGNE